MNAHARQLYREYFLGWGLSVYGLALIPLASRLWIGHTGPIDLEAALFALVLGASGCWEAATDRKTPGPLRILAGFMGLFCALYGAQNYGDIATAAELKPAHHLEISPWWLYWVLIIAFSVASLLYKRQVLEGRAIAEERNARNS